MPHWKAIMKTAAAGILIYLLLKICLRFLTPFLLSLCISIVIETVIRFLMGKLRTGRTISTVIALLLFCGLFVSISYLIVYYAYLGVVNLLKNLPQFYMMINSLLQKYYIFMKENFNMGLSGENLLNADKVIYEMMNVLGSLKDGMISLVNSLPDIAIYLSFSMIAAFFISRDKEIILSIVKRVMPRRVLNITMNLYNSTVYITRTEIMLVIMSTAEAFIGFLLIGVEYAFILSVACGILDILPVVGTGLIFLPWSVCCLLRGDFLKGVSLICLYMIIIVTREMMEARMMGGRLKLHPLIVLLSIYLGLSFFGVVGAALGPLAASMLREIYKENIIGE